MAPFPDLPARLARFGPWPGRVRRLAALACLLLAAATAVTAHQPSSAHRAARTPAGPGNPIAARLRPGQVAVPVRVDGAAAGLVRAGDRIDLYAGPDGTALGEARCAAAGGPVGATLPVLAVPARADPPDPTSPARVVIAADRATAARIATLQGCTMFAVLDNSP